MPPDDVALLAAELLIDEQPGDRIYELTGPQVYTPQDVADAFGKVLGKRVTVQVTPREEWANVLASIGFSEDGIKNFIAMTDAVIDGRTEPEEEGTIAVKGNTTLDAYVNANLT